MSAGALVYMKLKAHRMQDRADVVNLLKAGLEAASARTYLRENAPGLLQRLDDCVAAAKAEQE